MVRAVRASPFGCQACFSATGGRYQSGACVDHRLGGKDQFDPQLGAMRPPEARSRLPEGALPFTAEFLRDNPNLHWGAGVPVEPSPTAPGITLPESISATATSITIRPAIGGWEVAVGSSAPTFCKTWGRVLIEVAKCGPVD